jgi:SHS2 domain-containing protein
MERAYRNLDHTGDIGVEVWGGSREELIENASWALVDTIADGGKIKPQREIHWEVSADSPESLLIRHLQEILYQLDAHGLVFSDYSVKFTGPNSLSCMAKGEPLSRKKHGFKTEIKAVTYHHLKIWKEDEKWWARIILDV